MPFVSITRLRVRSWSYVPAFVVQTLRIARQAARADGNLAVKLLRDRYLGWRTITFMWLMLTSRSIRSTSACHSFTMAPTSLSCAET
jgi:hypothetical protein